MSMDIAPEERDTLSSFLSDDSGAQSGYSPQGGVITGIWKQMMETVSGGLADDTAKEEATKVSHAELKGAKTKRSMS
jgi:hypothetical protein